VYSHELFFVLRIYEFSSLLQEKIGHWDTFDCLSMRRQGHSMSTENIEAQIRRDAEEEQRHYPPYFHIGNSSFDGILRVDEIKHSDWLRVSHEVHFNQS